MQYHHVGYRVKGFYNIIRYAMKADTNNEVVAAHRLGVLEFWNQYGLQAAIDHSGKSRRTLYAWKQAYREQGLTGLRSQSKAPRGKRSRHWSRAGVIQIRPLRRDFLNLGKEQVHILLKPWCQAQQVLCPSESTMGRLIADAPDRMRVSPPALTPGGKPKRYRRTPCQAPSQGLSSR